MAIQISGTTVIDNSRNILNIVTGTFTNVVVTTDLDIPSGTTAQRPGSPSVGSIRWNTDSSLLEIYTGTEWKGTSS